MKRQLRNSQTDEKVFKYVNIDEVYAIHARMIRIGGGRAGVRDFLLLHSATERPKASFGGEMLYPTLWLQAAAMLHSLIKNHPFTDGNKRTGFFSTVRFLRLNGYKLKAVKKEVVEFSVAVDNENPSLEEIAAWLKRHSKKGK